MAEIAHAFTEVNTEQTTVSASFVDVPGASIASGSFVTGKKYLIYVTAQVGNSLNNQRSEFQLVHNSTAFATSLHQYEQVSSGFKQGYGFCTVWTALSGEGIKMQFRAVTSTAQINFVSMLVINLTDDVAENTDWFFAVRSADDTLSSTPTDGASITFGIAGDWLILTCAQYNPAADTDRLTSAIIRSGEASSSLPLSDIEVQESASPNILTGLARVFTTTATSNTFKEQSAAPLGSPIRIHSAIFALNLSKFDKRVFAYTEAGENLSATNYATELQTVSITPSVAGDVWIGSYWGHNKNDAGNVGEFRIQVDDSDQPAGQTAANEQLRFGNLVTDIDPFLLSTLPNLTAAAHTIDLDASSSTTTGTPTGVERTIWAVSMELAAAVAEIPAARPAWNYKLHA